MRALPRRGNLASTDRKVVAVKRILIATDGTAGGQAAVAEATALARALCAAVIVVTVRPAIGLLGQPLYQRRLSAQLAKARATIDAARAILGREGIDADYEILEGDPAEEILAIAAAREVDLIAVGSRGLGPIPGALLGSVSAGVARRAECPVLVVKQTPARVRDEEPAAPAVPSAV